MREIIDNFFTWCNIDLIGKTKFSKTSYIYLILIPVIVKLSKSLPPLKVMVGEVEKEITISLPFSWYLFFFGALLIAFGTFLYYLFCPPFIKKYSDFGEFRNKGEADLFLIKLGEKHLKDDDDFKNLLKQKPFLNQTEDYDRGGGFMSPIVVNQSTNIEYNDNLKTVFHKLYDILNRKNICLIRITTIFYIAGIVCFIMVLGQNIWFVIKHM
jgi:hypothetical protein